MLVYVSPMNEEDGLAVTYGLFDARINHIMCGAWEAATSNYARGKIRRALDHIVEVAEQEKAERERAEEVN